MIRISSVASPTPTFKQDVKKLTQIFRGACGENAYSLINSFKLEETATAIIADTNEPHWLRYMAEQILAEREVIQKERNELEEAALKQSQNNS